MSAFTDQSVPWLMTVVASFTCAFAVVLIAAVVFVPPLWRAGFDQFNAWWHR